MSRIILDIPALFPASRQYPSLKLILVLLRNASRQGSVQQCRLSKPRKGDMSPWLASLAARAKLGLATSDP